MAASRSGTWRTQLAAVTVGARSGRGAVTVARAAADRMFTWLSEPAAFKFQVRVTGISSAGGKSVTVAERGPELGIQSSAQSLARRQITRRRRAVADQVSLLPSSELGCPFIQAKSASVTWRPLRGWQRRMLRPGTRRHGLRSFHHSLHQLSINCP